MPAMKTYGFFAETADAPVESFIFDRANVCSNDVAVEIWNP